MLFWQHISVPYSNTQTPLYCGAHPNRIAQDPRLLRSIRNAASPRKTDETLGPSRPRVHLPEQRHEQRRLPRPGGANDEVCAPALEQQLPVDVEDEPPGLLPARGGGGRLDVRVVRPCERGLLDPEGVFVVAGLGVLGRGVVSQELVKQFGLAGMSGAVGRR